MDRSVWFWRVLMAGALGLLLLGVGLWLFSPWKEAGAALTGMILGLHVAELPLALQVGKASGVGLARTVVMDLLFGFTWWLPVKRGIIK